MKPREFDELLKQKFDQNDFEYSPANWSRLEEALDGRAKKRGIIVGWFIPLVGVAASMALAFGVSFVMKTGGGSNTAYPTTVANSKIKSTIATDGNATTTLQVTTAEVSGSVQKTTSGIVNKAVSKKYGTVPATTVIEIVEDITGENEIASGHVLQSNVTAVKLPDLLDTTLLVKKKKKIAIANEPIYTFKNEVISPKTLRSSIIISGGFNFGNQSNGYSFGATARRMINKKVYVEGDVAFTGTNNVHKVTYLDQSPSANATYVNSNLNGSGFAAKSTFNSKSSSGDNITGDGSGSSGGVLKTANRQYSLYYAQITPTVGYQILKRMSIGVGPDFQKMLVDNRPETSALERGNIREVPMFDIGFMGKTEFTFSKNIKAAVYYREGINNVITPTNKFIDRNYLQVQLKCAILNK